MGHGVATLLLTAVAGYWVLERSVTHAKGDLKRVGQAVGWFVIVASIVCVACKVYALATCKGGVCPISRWPYPSTQQSSAPQEAPAQ